LYEEIDLIENKAKYDSVYYVIKTGEKKRITTDGKVIEFADSLNNIMKDYNDCLHIGFALAGKCSCLITCDHELIEKREKIERFLLSKCITLTIKTPSEFALEY
jgi:predicted nucleic acid-binding protein